MDTLLINRPLSVLTYSLTYLLTYLFTGTLVTSFLSYLLVYSFTYLFAEYKHETSDKTDRVSCRLTYILPSAKGNCLSCFSVISYIILVTVCH